MSEKIYGEIVKGWSESELARFAQQQFHHSTTTGSTNDDLLALARAGKAKPFDLRSTDFQTSGRGRRGDKWEATPGRNLLFSIALPLTMERENWSRLPHLTACLIGSAIEGILGPGHTLQAKWPNDLLFEGKKLAGILVEIAMTPQPVAVVGIGINVNLRREELPPELRKTATSIYEILECESSRWFLLGLILDGFLKQFPSSIIDFDPTLKWMTSRDFLIGKDLEVRSGLHSYKGTGAGLGPGGELLLETEDGRQIVIVSAEEIRWNREA